MYIPAIVVKDTQRFVQSTNPVLLFVEERCRFAVGEMVKPPDLYKAYVERCNEGRNRPLARNRFYDQILINYKGIKKAQYGNDRIRVYAGIGLRA